MRNIKVKMRNIKVTGEKNKDYCGNDEEYKIIGKMRNIVKISRLH